MPKTRFDIETGKLQVVAAAHAEDFEEIQSQIESVGGLEKVVVEDFEEMIMS